MNIIKNAKKDSEKKDVNDKRQGKVAERYQNLSEEQKQKLHEHMRNYYLLYKLFICLIRFF